MCQQFKNDVWIEENFGNANFGDKRISKRLLKIANKMSQRPESTIPLQMESWHDTKACYNFLRNEKVTLKRIQDVHRYKIKTQASGKTVLFVQDTSEIDYTNLEATEGLGFIGNHKSKGLMFNSCLAIEPNEKNPQVIGLSHQQIWTRKNLSLNKNETRTQRNKRKKESDV